MKRSPSGTDVICRRMTPADRDSFHYCLADLPPQYLPTAINLSQNPKHGTSPPEI